MSSLSNNFLEFYSNITPSFRRVITTHNSACHCMSRTRSIQHTAYCNTAALHRSLQYIQNRQLHTHTHIVSYKGAGVLHKVCVILGAVTTPWSLKALMTCFYLSKKNTRAPPRSTREASRTSCTCSCERTGSHQEAFQLVLVISAGRKRVFVPPPVWMLCRLV